jgi:hypothetical protein
VQQKDRKVKDKDGEKKGSSRKMDKKLDKPTIFASGREALQNVPQSEIDKHKKDKADCWRCRRLGHKMYKCYAKKIVGGTDLSSRGKMASLGKRKQDNEVEEDKEYEKSKGKDKKAKTAAVQQDDEDIDIPDAQPRI